MTRVRDTAAVGICVSAALLGSLAIYQGWAVMANVAIYVGGVWSFMGNWWGGRFSRAGRGLFHLSLSETYRQAKAGTLPKDPPLARGIINSGTLLILIGIILLISGISIG